MRVVADVGKLYKGRLGGGRPLRESNKETVLAIRPQALKRFENPEGLDRVVRIVPPQTWIALVVLIIIVATSLAWALFGSIDVEILGRGLISREGGLSRSFAPEASIVESADVAIGAHVRRGGRIARLRTAAGTIVRRTRAIDGRVVSITVVQGSFVAPGARIASVEPLGHGFEAIVYIPIGRRRPVEVGMHAEVSHFDTPPEAYGFIQGIVTSVAPYPASPERVRLNLANDEVNKQLLDRGPVKEVHIALLTDERSPTGLRWSSGHGPRFAIAGGSLCNARIVLERRRPINFVFPT